MLSDQGKVVREFFGDLFIDTYLQTMAKDFEEFAKMTPAQETQILMN